MFSFLFLILVGLLLLCTESVKLSPALKSSLKLNENVDVLVQFGSNEESLQELRSMTFKTRTEKLKTLSSVLVKDGIKKQKPLLDFLSSKIQFNSSLNIEFQSYWILNMILIRNASLEILNEVRYLPAVTQIHENSKIFLEKPILRDVISEIRDSETIEWGVMKIRAPEVWELGLNGSGVVIGSIDTGARGSHELLHSSYIGDFGWFDPVEGSLLPVDTNGHGTHTIGTMVGENGIGIAPGAQWMSCRAFDSSGSADLGNILACFQFLTCPTDAMGQNADCGKAPHIVSNSWGSAGGGLPIFQELIDTWHEGGIIPVFASGNEGDKGCGSVNSPGDYNALSVGSVGPSDTISSFSSLGPGAFLDFEPKPDLVAPGEGIYSAFSGSDSDYALQSGTSMATPHVSGAIALLLQQNSTLSYDQVKDALFHGLETKIETLGDRNCGGVSDSRVPNNAFGHGRLDVFNSVLYLRGSLPNDGNLVLSSGLLWVIIIIFAYFEF